MMDHDLRSRRDDRLTQAVGVKDVAVNRLGAKGGDGLRAGGATSHAGHVVTELDQSWHEQTASDS